MRSLSVKRMSSTSRKRFAFSTHEQRVVYFELKKSRCLDSHREFGKLLMRGLF